MGKPLVGSCLCTDGLFWALGKIHLCKGMEKVMVGWGDQWRPCPQMLEHMQVRQMCLPGKRFTQGMCPASFDCPEGK